ncbi:DUF6515 family protein [Celerinatantimonas yamalensis]|uniref:DUF6515 family protein n=1 Tax=Celerinatantimonas yamalensis TaxID=559956 RepID=A0ABW9G7I4_9GAMM
MNRHHWCNQLTWLMISFLLSSMVSIQMAQAHPEFHPREPFHPWFSASPRSHGPRLPNDAAWMVIAGINYAIIDGLYYQHSGDRYIYVDHPPSIPPSNTTIVIDNTDALQSDAASTTILPGTLVEKLPRQYKTVSVNGRDYYVSGRIWYAALAKNQGFIVVKAQL